MYLLLEPGLVEFAVLFGFCILTLSVFRTKLHGCILLAVAITAGRVVWDLAVTRGYINTEFAQYYDPFLETGRSLWVLLYLFLPLGLTKLEKYTFDELGLWIFLLTRFTTLFFDVCGQPKEVAEAGWREMGLVYNSSINPAIIAMTLPFSRLLKDRRIRWVLEGLTLYVVAHSAKMTPLLVYATVQGARLLQWNWDMFSPFLLAVPCFGSILFFLRPTYFTALDWNLHIPQRVEGYAFFIKSFHEHFSWLKGFGINKFYSMGPALEHMKLGKTQDFWFFAHSDFLELLLEQGVIGAIPWIIVMGMVIYRSFRDNRKIFECALGMIVCMLFYFPLHTAMGALVAVLCLSVLKVEPSA